MLIIVGCGHVPIIGTHPTSQKDTLLDSLSPDRPGWITETPKALGCKYFIGEEFGR
jgi:hypothetical protein